jgi:2-polyprenyl-3-methyl-5-hydroxy-6-metoxy-1,4-benzoquinol methylase
VVQPLGGTGDGAHATPPADADPAAARPPSTIVIDADAFNRFEAEGWEARAASYSFLRPITGRVINALLAAVEAGPDTQLIDVGTGPGDLAAAAAELGADPVGIDVAPSMVRRAALAHPRIPFRTGSFEAIPGGSDAFDAVVGNFVFNHVGRPEVALAEARRVLRPGGRLAFSTWDAARRNRILGLLLDAVEAADAPPPAGVPPGPTNFRTDDELRELVSAAGFDHVGVSHLHFEAHVPDTETLWRGVLDSAVRIPPLVTLQPPDVQARIRDAFETLCRVHLRPGGTLAIPVSVQVTQGSSRD